MLHVYYDLHLYNQCALSDVMHAGVVYLGMILMKGYSCVNAFTVKPC